MLSGGLPATCLNLTHSDDLIEFFFVPTVCTGHCSNYQFMCDDGCCIDIAYACDGKQHCPDRSDEDFCSNCEDTSPSLQGMNLENCCEY